jgi:8-oxo-dGTP pyrophosphatase MutT (NUDIX family)
VSEATPTRDFTVAVFVVHGGRVLLHFHEKLQRWLPPGGHIEPNEMPDDAAVREVMEETGVACTLIGDPRMRHDDPALPRQLATPAGIQLEQIGPDHQHIDLIYFAAGSPSEPRPQVDWFGLDQLEPLHLTEEVATWCRLAVEAVTAQPR